MADDDSGSSQLTAYGYPGDTTPDWNSEHAIGDRNNHLQATPDHQSVALTESEREARFGVTGKSTGLAFQYQGHTYWDEDTAPESNRRIDVYDPSHPPDLTLRSGSHRLRTDTSDVRRLQNLAAEQYDVLLPDSPEPPEEAPKQDTETPIEKIKKASPETAKWPVEQFLAKLQESFPHVPPDQIKVFAVTKGGSELIKKQEEAALTPLERFREFSPDLATGDDDKDINFLHSQLEPDTPLDQFRDKVNPPSPIISFLKNALPLALRATAGTIEGAAKDPVKAFSLDPNKPQSLGLMSGAEETYGKFEEFPKAATNVLTNLYKTAGIYNWTKGASDWLAKTVPAYGAANDAFKNLVNSLSDRAKEWQKQGAQASAAIPSDPASQALGVVGQAVGSAPDIAVSFGLGSTSRAAALFGMLYEGTSGYGHAIEMKQKNSLLQGVTAAGFRQFAQYLMNTGSGRIVSGIANSFATVADEEIDKWARGEPNNITRDGKAAAVGLLTGLMMGGHEAKPVPSELEPIDPNEPLQLRYSPPMEGPAPVAEAPETPSEPTPIDPNLRGQDYIDALEARSNRPPPVPKEERRFTMRWSFDNHPAPVAEELKKAHEAHENGDVDVAAQHIDKAFVFMPDAQKRVEAKKFVAKVDELAGKPPAPAAKAEMPKFAKEVFNDYYFSGIPFFPKAVSDWFEAGYSKVKDSFEEEEKKVRSVLRPESLSREAEVFGQTVKAEEARSEAASVMIPHEISRKAGAKDMIGTPMGDFFGKLTGDINRFRFGDRAENQERFFNNFSKAEQIQQFVDFQEGRKIKNPTADWFFRNVQKPVYEAIRKREEHYHVEYDARENYFYQLLKNPKSDTAKLKESFAKAGIDPNFTKPRDMTLAQRLAMDHEMVTTNATRLMQMRWAASERVIQKIRDLQQAESQGSAFNTKRADIPDYAKNWPVDRTADKQSYHVSPDIIPILNNKFDQRSLFHLAGIGPFERFAASLKGFTAGLLSWSMFHPLHIMDITSSDIAAEALRRMQAGVGTPADALNLAVNQVPFLGSLPGVARAYRKYGDAVNVLMGHMPLSEASPEMLRDIKDFQDMGLVAETNSERQMQFIQWANDRVPQWIKRDSVGGQLIKAGSDLLLNKPFTKWWFGVVTPRLKFASAMMRRDTLAKTRPDLFRDANRGALLREYGNIHRDIEGRFGEMHYDNLLWPRMLKQAGTTHLLSLGWQLGMFRTMGDGVIDTWTNLAHRKAIIEEWKTKGADAAASKAVTNRMAFQALYVTRGLLTGAAITYFLGGKKQPDFWDGVYPVVGKDAQGRDKRVNMQYFLKDVPALHEYMRQEGSALGGVERMAINKMNPMVSAVIQAAGNKDYMGHAIGTMPDRILYLFKQMAPISLQNAEVPGETPTDKVMAFLGYSPSGRWTMRSDWENKIVSQMVQGNNFGPMIDARDQYRQAFIAKDPEAIKSAHDNLKHLGATDKEIASIEKNSKLTTAQKAFKRLRHDMQLKDLQEMKPDERSLWIPYASPAVRAKVKAQ